MLRANFGPRMANVLLPALAELTASQDIVVMNFGLWSNDPAELEMHTAVFESTLRFHLGRLPARTFWRETSAQHYSTPSGVSSQISYKLLSRCHASYCLLNPSCYCVDSMLKDAPSMRHLTGFPHSMPRYSREFSLCRHVRHGKAYCRANVQACLPWSQCDYWNRWRCDSYARFSTAKSVQPRGVGTQYRIGRWLQKQSNTACS